MNGHDTYYEVIKWADQDKEFDQNGDEVKEEPEDGFDNEESKYPDLSNPMIDREPQDELDRVTNRDSYSFFQNNCQL